MALTYVYLLLHVTIGAVYLSMVASISTANSLTLKLIPTHSIGSQFFPKNLSLSETHKINAALSYSRYLHFRSIANNSTRIPSTSKVFTDALRPPVVPLPYSCYSMALSIGDPPYITYLLADTGSEDTWVQCKGCKNCFQIGNGPFDYNSSKTFTSLPCSSPYCSPKTCKGDTCIFTIRYRGSETGGIVANETITFTNEDKSLQPVRLVIGCALTAPGVFFGIDGPDNKISGVFGLGIGPRSFLTQTAQFSQWRFSYCLPPWQKALQVYTYLDIGSDANVSGPNVQTVPMMFGKYLLDVIDISVSGFPLQLDPAIFLLKSDMTGGFTIDSGSSYTFLVPEAYDAVRNAIEESLNKFNLQPLPPHGGIFNFCYEYPFSVAVLEFPSVTFHFTNGVDLEVSFWNVFINFDEKACMTILPIDEEGPNILGATQQADYRFLYDGLSSSLSFVSEVCDSS